MVSPAVALIALGALIVGISKFGGVRDVFGLEGSDLVGKNQQSQSGEVTTPDLQKNPSIPIPEGSQITVATIQSDQILRTDVVSKQKLNQNASKPQIKTVFNNPKEGGSEPQAGVVVSSNTSLKNTVLGLNQEQVNEIRAQPFTKQELQDITNLTERFNKKSEASKKVSDSPTEIIFKKREQEAIAKQIFNSKSVQNPNFELGLPSDASQSDIQLAIQQRQERDQVLAKVEENKALSIQRTETGEQILQTIKKSGMNQKDFLLNKGIALRGSNLNAKAIAKLQEKGLI